MSGGARSFMLSPSGQLTCTRSNRVCFPALMNSGSAFPTAIGSEQRGVGERITPVPLPPHGRRVVGPAFLLSLLGQAHPCPSNQYQLYCSAQARYRTSQLSQVLLWLVRGRDKSPTIMTPRPALLTASGGKGEGDKGNLLATQVMLWQKSDRDSSPVSTSNGASTLPGEV